MTRSGTFEDWVRNEQAEGRLPLSKTLVGHCRDCRWWGGAGPNMGADRWWQACQRAAEPEAKVVLARSDPYVSAGLMTRRDYGCVQFEAREQEC